MRVLISWTMLFSSWKTYIFEATSWTKFDHEEQKWLSQADLRAGASDARPLTIRNVKNTWPSLSSSSLLLPSLFPFSSFFSSCPPKTPHFLGKNAKIVIMMSIFDPTRGSYSLGRVLLRRNTLYIPLSWTLSSSKHRLLGTCQSEGPKSAVVVGLPHCSFEESPPLKMTEFLADGPDWHLRSCFCSGLSLFSTVDVWSGSSIDEFHWFNSWG